MRTQGLYEVIVHGGEGIELSDCLNVWSKQGCLPAAIERRAHENYALDYAFGVPDEKIPVFCKSGKSSVLEEHLGESLGL